MSPRAVSHLPDPVRKAIAWTLYCAPLPGRNRRNREQAERWRKLIEP